MKLPSDIASLVVRRGGSRRVFVADGSDRIEVFNAGVNGDVAGRFKDFWKDDRV